MSNDSAVNIQAILAEIESVRQVCPTLFIGYVQF